MPSYIPSTRNTDSHRSAMLSLRRISFALRRPFGIEIANPSNNDYRCRCPLPEHEPDQALLAELRRLPQVHPGQGRGLCPLPPVLAGLPVTVPQRMVRAVGRAERYVHLHRGNPWTRADRLRQRLETSRCAWSKEDELSSEQSIDVWDHMGPRF